MRVKDELRLPHPVNDYERRLLETILEEGESGLRSALLNQADSAQVTWVESRGQPAILFSVPASSPRASSSGIVAELERVDRDGVRIHMLLHVSEGLLAELEVYREDGDAVIDLPRLED
jgi:uncharacterized protein DUF6984